MLDEKEAYTYAKQCSNKREAPVVKFPARTPAGSIQQIQKEAGQIHTRITEKVKHSYGWGDKIKVPNYNASYTEEGGKEGSNLRLTSISNLEVVKNW